MVLSPHSRQRFFHGIYQPLKDQSSLCSFSFIFFSKRQLPNPVSSSSPSQLYFLNFFVTKSIVAQSDAPAALNWMLYFSLFSQLYCAAVPKNQQRALSFEFYCFIVIYINSLNYLISFPFFLFFCNASSLRILFHQGSYKDKFRKVVSWFPLRQGASEMLLKNWGHRSIF